MARCQHKQTRITKERGFGGSVAGPKGDENPMAHGGRAFSEVCDKCGATREVNQNGLHFEESEWSRG